MTPRRNLFTLNRLAFLRHHHAKLKDSRGQKAWGGVFDQATDRRVEEFTESVSFDRRLYAQDIEGSIAHAQMLAKVGLLTGRRVPAD